MKTALALALFATIGLAASAQAMPVAPIQSNDMIETVAQGCGPGMRRNINGHCRPAVMVKRPCPPGTFKNRFGVCRPIR